MPRRAAGFTLIELMAVVVVLAVIGGVALPRYFDYTDRARYSDMKGTAGGVQEALHLAKLAYFAGAPAGYPPDADDNKAPDHFGDVAAGEPTLFDGILSPPIDSKPNGWKTWSVFPSGPFYVYFYDTDGNGIWDGGANEALLFYNNVTGGLGVVMPPTP